MLDGPYANDTWKGQEIGVIEVAADAPKEAKTYQVAVPAVEGLKGKHAIYLVAEGPEVEQPQRNRPPFGGRQMQPQRPEGLFDLHGIGFSTSSTTCTPPVVPTVTITVDGQRLNLPSTPIRGTNANGYTDVTHYQTYAPMKEGSVIKATASDPAVSITVGKIVDGRASVKCTYNGQDKVYLIN